MNNQLKKSKLKNRGWCT